MSGGHLLIPAEDAIAWLVLLTSSSAKRVPVYLSGKQEPSAYVSGTLPQRSARLAKRVGLWDLRDSLQVEIGLAPAASYALLWAWLESPDSVRRAYRFRPAPSVVLRMGGSCRRLLLWALRETLSAPAITEENRRIAYALHAPQKYADPERLRIPVPGTFLRVNRKRPAPVLITRLAPGSTYTAKQVSGRLKAPPPPFMQRLREGRVNRR